MRAGGGGRWGGGASLNCQCGYKTFLQAFRNRIILISKSTDQMEFLFASFRFALSSLEKHDLPRVHLVAAAPI